LIFVTIGNAKQSFRRLLDAVDSIAETGFFNSEPILIQSGNDFQFQSSRCEVKPFISMDEFNEAMEAASLIICHGGCGTQLHAIRLGKVPVVMPRRKKYSEHVNDHQVQLVEALAAQGKIVPAYETGDLEAAITRARELNENPVILAPSPMLSLVAQAIDELTGRAA
jgi:UDP-N-acetylglucosamine transferase subunit ALG13